jgi:MFS family permease
MRELMRHRDFRLLMSGQTLSMFGDTAMLLVLAMWGKELTGSNGVAGSILAAVALPSLIAPFGGVVIDRFRRRTVMIVTDIATAAAIGSLLLVNGREDLWLLYVVAFAYGASLIAFQSARAALLHTMLPDAMLGPANGSLSTVREALRLIGPLTGAALFAAFGGAAVVLLDIATFLLSAAFLAAMRLRESRPHPRELHVLTEAAAGGRHLLRSRVLRATVVATIITMLAIGIGESVYFAVVDEGLGRPVAFIGVLGSMQGVGAIIGGLAITSLIARTGELRPVAVGLGLISAGSLLAMSSNLLVVGAGSVLFGAGLPVVVVCIMTIIQRRTPNELQGRAFTAFELVAGLPQLLSIVAGAILVSLVDYRVLLAGMAIGLGVAAVYAFVRLREPIAPSPLADGPLFDDQVTVGLHPFEQPTVVAD